MVVIKKCTEYDIEKLIKIFRDIFQMLGGIEKYIKIGTKVAIKPNLVMKKRPDVAATTHPDFIQALCIVIQEAGGIVTIIDSPGGFYSERLLAGVYRLCGMEKVSKDTGAKLNYDLSETQVDNVEGMLLKKVTVLKPLVDADIIINVPKLKTHGQMMYTGVVKNMFGAVPGVLKAEYHYRMPEYDDFANALIDVFLSVKPCLNIMDAVIGMEGHGPTAGEPRKIGLVLASDDAFKLDFTALNIIGVDPQKIPIVKNAIKRKLCPASIKEIELLGEDLEKIKINDFDIPQLEELKTIQFLSKGVLKHVMNTLRPKPYFLHKKCVGCSDCMNHCPARIIKMIDGKPKADLSKCIRCFCCQELCPTKAISIRRHPLVGIIVKNRKSSKEKKEFWR